MRLISYIYLCYSLEPCHQLSSHQTSSPQHLCYPLRRQFGKKSPSWLWQLTQPIPSSCFRTPVIQKQQRHHWKIHPILGQQTQGSYQKPRQSESSSLHQSSRKLRTYRRPRCLQTIPWRKSPSHQLPTSFNGCRHGPSCQIITKICPTCSLQHLPQHRRKPRITLCCCIPTHEDLPIRSIAPTYGCIHWTRHEQTS